MVKDRRRFTYHVFHEGIKESNKQVSQEYFLFAEFLFRLLDYPHQVAISNNQVSQYLVYGKDNTFI